MSAAAGTATALAAPAGWRGWVAPWAAGFVPAAESLLEAVLHPDRALRDDARSRVLLFDSLPGAGPGAPPSRWVAKRPLWKDNRLWNRLTTALRAGEARQAFERAVQLQAAGFPVPRPLACLERRAGGLVVESWFWYEYVDGRPVEESDWPRIVELLEALHAAGWVHRDTHLANWLKTDAGVVALDANPRRLTRGPRGRRDAAYDFVLLRNCDPRTLPLLPGVGGRAWRRAEATNARVQGWRRLKRWLRGRG